MFFFFADIFGPVSRRRRFKEPKSNGSTKLLLIPIGKYILLNNLILLSINFFFYATHFQCIEKKTTTNDEHFEKYKNVEIGLFFFF